MSATPRIPVPDSLDAPLPMTLPRLAEKKRLHEPIVMVTAYDYPSAQVAEEAGVDVVLVGDSGAMTVLGYPSTVPVSTEEMLMLACAVRRGCKTPFLVGDLPFGSYEASDEQAIATAQRFIKEAGCDAVKLERGGTSVQRARAIVDSGIPVMGHVGLTPQTATSLGGYRAQGRTAERALSVARDAIALEDAGCFSVVFEAIPAAVAELLAPRLEIPVIGIGAGAGTDGQVLVFHDLLGIYDGHAPRFAKRYGEIKAQMVAGVAQYAAEVRSAAFPAPEHAYSIDDEELDQFRAAVEAEAGGATEAGTGREAGVAPPAGPQARICPPGNTMKGRCRASHTCSPPATGCISNCSRRRARTSFRHRTCSTVLLSNYPDSKDLAAEILVCEHEGDRITHDIINRLNHTFVTPIDREDILALASALDDIVDFTEEVADYLGLYKIEAPMDQAIKLAHVLKASCRQIADAIPRLRGFRDISHYTVEINRLENEGDRITREAVASLFDGGIDPMVVIRWKDLFERLEAAIDAAERVANILEGIVIKNS